MHLDGTHARLGLRGHDDKLIAFVKLAAPQRPRDHGAEALDGEHAINGHARDVSGLGVLGARARFVQSGAQLVKACSCAA